MEKSQGGERKLDKHHVQSKSAKPLFATSTGPPRPTSFEQSTGVSEASTERRDGVLMATMQSRSRCSACVTRHQQTALGG